jgi:Fe-S oxidoreductase
MRQEIVNQELAPPIVNELDLKLKRWSNPYAEAVPGEPKLEGTVALFVGDDARYLDDETLPAALTLLEAVGVNPVQIGIGRNNGYLASSLGLHSTAAQLIRATLLELETSGANTMLVLSPGDYYAFGQMSEERLGIEWPSGVVLQEVTTWQQES